MTFAPSVNVLKLSALEVLSRGEVNISPLDALKSIIISGILIHGDTSPLFADTRARVAYIRSPCNEQVA